MAPLKRFASQAGFSETVAGHLALCRRNSRLNGQARVENVPKMVQSLPSSVLRALNSEDSGIFDLFYSRKRRPLCLLLKTTERCFRLCLSSVSWRFRLHIFSRTWCAPLRSQLLAHYIIRLHGIWTRFWSTCQAPL